MEKVSDIDNLRVAQLLKLQMKVKRLGPNELADHLGCSHTTVSFWTNWPKYKRPLPANRIDQLADALGMDARLLDAQAA